MIEDTIKTRRTVSIKVKNNSFNLRLIRTFGKYNIVSIRTIAGMYLIINYKSLHTPSRKRISTRIKIEIFTKKPECAPL